jgi:hypothetical protein
MASGLAVPPAAKTSDENPRTKNTETPDKHKNFFIQSSNYFIVFILPKTARIVSYPAFLVAVNIVVRHIKH